MHVDPSGLRPVHIDDFWDWWLGFLPKEVTSHPAWAAIAVDFRDELEQGCIGVAHIGFGYRQGESLPLDECYTNAFRARDRMRKMNAKRECEHDDCRNLWGKTPKANVFAVAFYNETSRGRQEVDLTPKPDGSIDVSVGGWPAIFSHPPSGGYNFDFFYHGWDGYWYHANHSHRRPTDPMVVKRKDWEAFKRIIRRYLSTDTFTDVLFCVACERQYQTHPSQ